MATKIYKKNDLRVLIGKTVAVVGYGSQGHAHALNLRDSGISVVVATRHPVEAKKAGFKVCRVSEAVRMADVIMITLPDMIQAEVYENEIAPNLEEGKAVGFAHGFNIHFGVIKPAKDIDVFMVAPNGPGHLLRKLFEDGSGLPGIIAVERDFSGKCKKIAMAYAGGIGCMRMGVIETTFKEECETDLFAEQAVLCGGLTSLIKGAFETLVNAGYNEELAYFCCLHEVKLLGDLIHYNGIAGMRDMISDTAEWGDYQVGDRIIGKESKAEMKKVLKEIQNGEFAKKWLKEASTGMKNVAKYRKKAREHKIEKIGDKLRGVMF